MNLPAFVRQHKPAVAAAGVGLLLLFYLRARSRSAATVDTTTTPAATDTTGTTGTTDTSAGSPDAATAAALEGLQSGLTDLQTQQANDEAALQSQTEALAQAQQQLSDLSSAGAWPTIGGDPGPIPPDLTQTEPPPSPLPSVRVAPAAARTGSKHAASSIGAVVRSAGVPAAIHVGGATGTVRANPAVVNEYVVAAPAQKRALSTALFAPISTAPKRVTSIQHQTGGRGTPHL